ncbi:Zn-dependent exopeptidase [Tothia fuscella]|uniref:Zn-dependent exopeptidase n=1 Tax=Tothia fuscella TaxID=1048955 RepID=A0A9P4P0U1_9PEZI|nr:Zn-dependent exopeptidase [Tothia fuscella]
MKSLLPRLAFVARIVFVFAKQVPLLETSIAHGEALPHTNSDELLYLHRKLIQTESITENEKEVGEWLATYLEDKGLTVEKQEVAKDRYNIIAYKGDKRETKVLVTSHIDTVPPFWPYELRVSGTEIWGRGSVDAKACVAAQTIAVLSLINPASHSIPNDALSLLFVVGEEAGGEGMKFFSKHKPTNYSAVIFGEPTEGKLAAGHKGILGFRIKVKGKAAHSGYPWLGVSANNLMVEALGILLELEKSLPSSEKYGKTTMNIGKIEGGVAANVVAENAEANIAIRIAAGEPQTIVEIVDRSLKNLKKKALASGGEFEVEYNGNGYGPVPIDTDVKGFQSITVNYGTDVPNLKGDHKRYLYGPGSIFVAHSDHEHLKVKELEQAVVDYQRIILAVLK